MRGDLTRAGSTDIVAGRGSATVLFLA